MRETDSLLFNRINLPRFTMNILKFEKKLFFFKDYQGGENV